MSNRVPNERLGTSRFIKAGVNVKAVFTSLNMAFLPISRSPFKATPIPSAYLINLCFAVLCKFLGISVAFWERDILSFKGLVKLRKI